MMLRRLRGGSSGQRAEPMLDLELFKVPTMTPSLLAAMFQSLANFAVLFLLLMYLQGVRQLSPIHASLLLVPGYMVGGVVGPFAGPLRRPPRGRAPGDGRPRDPGAGILAYARFGLHTRDCWAVVVAYIVGAIGAGCFFPSNNSAVMKAAPGDGFGIASGLLRTFANVGMVFSFALAILVASESITEAKAFAIFVGTSSLSRLDRGGLHRRHPRRLLLVDGADAGCRRPFGLARPRNPNPSRQSGTTRHTCDADVHSTSRPDGTARREEIGHHDASHRKDSRLGWWMAKSMGAISYLGSDRLTWASLTD